MIPTEEYDDFSGFPCYEFNPSLGLEMDDWRCIRCRKFLTTECEHLELFVDEEIEEY